MKTLTVAVIFGLFGAIAVSFSFAMQWPTWVMFIAWVSFYLFGKTVVSSLKAFLQIELGCLMGIAIQFTGMLLGKTIGEFSLPIAVFIFIGSLAYISKVKALSNIPAWFLGLIILFGVHPEMTLSSLQQLVIPVIAGFVFAGLNDAAVVWVMKTSKQTETNHPL